LLNIKGFSVHLSIVQAPGPVLGFRF
jgi:hypothetical protein